MKINWIKISNILSFEYAENMDNCQKIDFGKNLNILIGANGSGKSNFLEIINQIFKTSLIMECYRYDDNIVEFERTGDTNTLKQTLVFNSQRKSLLQKNDSSDSTLKKIHIEIELSDYDVDNMKFVIDNIDRINELLAKYSNIGTAIRKPEKDFELKRKILLPLQFDLFEMNVLGMPDLIDLSDLFIFQYARWFQFLQHIIDIANIRENEKWEPLKNTFALLSSSRNYSSVGEVVPATTERDAVNQLMNEIFSEGIKTGIAGEPISIKYVKDKLVKECANVEIDLSKGKIHNKGKKTIELIKTPIFTKINELLTKHLDLELFFEKESSTKYLFYFKEIKTNKKIDINRLSSGQKELLLFIFTLYGNDLREGLMIIDEPELHLHTQWQKKYLEIVYESINDLKIQFIMATHSPVMVNSQTLEHIHRFYKYDDKITRVVNPNVTTDEKDLIQILTYTNSAKIFFSNKVVLVEGDSDEYFFRFFFDQYKIRTKKMDLDIEFLYIGGKGRYPLWKDFLNKYEIKTYYIGDLDNIFNSTFSIIDDALMKPLETSFEALSDTTNKMKTVPKYEKGSKLYNKDLLNFIKTTKSSEWNTIKSRIVAQYPNKIFILQEGELENYLDSHSKLKGVIEFCKNKFSDWQGDIKNKAKFDEFNKIFDLIVT